MIRGVRATFDEHWRARLHLILLLFAVFTFIGAYSATQVHLTTADTPKPVTWRSAIFSEFTYAYCALALSPVVIQLARRFPFERGRWLSHAAVHVLAMPVYSGLAKLGWDIIVDPPTGYFHHNFSFASMFHSLVSYSDYGVILYGLILLLYQTVEASRKYERQMVNAARLQMQLAQAQVQSLKMQLHPHFLFNTLNSISALIRDNPEAAETMIARLSDLLRRALESSSAQEIPLRQELDFVKLYLAIEQTRFEDRLHVDFEIDPNTSEALVPNMILQPLVENAIRHGISHRTHDGHIFISAKKRGRDLLLKVADSGSGLGPPPIMALKEGIGLASTRGRLERLYGGGQCLQLETPESGGLIARIVMPFSTEASRRLDGED